MTSRLILEAVLIELNKVQAPALKLYEFNYLCNKAISQYVNKIYNVYDMNQQSTDDLRVLSSHAILTPTKMISPSKAAREATYEVYLPLDYLHLLNCVCVFEVKTKNKCDEEGSFVEVPATRLTADSWGPIMSDVYNRPSPKRPYYYLHYRNTEQNLPTNPVSEENLGGTDIIIDKDKPDYPNHSRSIPLSILNQNEESESASVVEKPIGIRLGNTSNVRCEIRYGRNDSVYQLVEVLIDYLKVPQYIHLTLELVDLIDDTSQIMEFPDYVNQQIIDELVHLVMERSSDPRLQTNIAIDQSIARPGQSLQTAR